MKRVLTGLAKIAPGVYATLTMAVSGILLAACGGYVRVPFEVSGPVALPPGLSGEVRAGGLTTLHLDGLDLRVEARNQRAKGAALAIVPLMVFPVPMILPAHETTTESAHAPLLVFLELDPQVRGYAFDPMALRVTEAGAVALAPRAFVGPGRTSGERCLDPESRKDHLLRAVDARSFPLERHEDPTCFVLVFEKTIPPEAAFRLDLGGLTRNGEPVVVPGLEFSRRRASSFGEPRTWRPAALER